jgi:hypothetical protein
LHDNAQEAILPEGAFWDQEAIPPEGAFWDQEAIPPEGAFWDQEGRRKVILRIQYKSYWESIVNPAQLEPDA